MKNQIRDMLRRKNKMCDSFPPFNAFKIRLEICLGFSSETAVASQCCFRISNDVFKITLATVQLERILDRIMDTQFIKFIGLCGSVKKCKLNHRDSSGIWDYLVDLFQDTELRSIEARSLYLRLFRTRA